MQPDHIWTGPDLTIPMISKQQRSETPVGMKGHWLQAGNSTNKPVDWQITYLLWDSVPHQQRMELDYSMVSPDPMCEQIPCSRWLFSFIYIRVIGLE